MLSFETNVFRNARTMLDLAEGFFPRDAAPRERRL
jgi:hypothetical protein